ncbi:flagellar basal-body MS-ring/collar protein FliF [Cohaesibacter celericrescens]|uniref:flagellar basal-body MS-ring/collar protein FliF n=1 Tax=Cohaesibacter celericrescens TaxID=2067669 RepID=UPI003564EB2F
MPGSEQAEKIWSNLKELGPKRLMALGIIGVLTLFFVGGGAYLLSRPQLTTLYSGLDREDITRIGSALQDSGIQFDVNTESSAVLVSHASAKRARMLLAERGLPRGKSAGYELFDDLGSLGLTSFMQEITRVRAIEGELGRTIQSMKDVQAARVHIVLPEKGSFRSKDQPPSASVVIKTAGAGNFHTAQAVRFLVAAAVPGMVPDKVTVLDSSGTLLASGQGEHNTSAGEMEGLADRVSNRIQENIRKTLTPYLGLSNFQVSVAAKLNTDKQRVAETIFDPNSRIERSVQTVRASESAQNATSQKPTTVEQNLPDSKVDAGGEDQSIEENNRREETVNYEISSKKIEQTREGYDVERLSIAVLVNRQHLVQTLEEGIEETAINEALDKHVEEIRQLAASSAGFDETRGDQIKVATVNFEVGTGDLAPLEPYSFSQVLLRQSSDIINAISILLVSGLLIWFGLRPAVNSLIPKLIANDNAAPQEADLQEAAIALDAPEASINGALLEDLSRKLEASPVRKLEQVVELHEEQSAAILKQWFYQTEHA